MSLILVMIDIITAEGEIIFPWQIFVLKNYIQNFYNPKHANTP